MKIIRTLATILTLAITCSATAQTITPPTRRAKTPTVEYHQPDLKPGYRGFANFAWVMGVGEWAVDRVEFATVHGYQICPNLFVGAGVSLDYYCSGCASSLSLPVFGDIRAEFNTGKAMPFIDIRTGYALEIDDVKGFYFSPSIGVKHHQLNVSLGYVLQRTRFDVFGVHILPWVHSCSAIAVRIGCDF